MKTRLFPLMALVMAMVLVALFEAVWDAEAVPALAGNLPTSFISDAHEQSAETNPSQQESKLVEQGGYDCSAVTVIPQSECLALVALYNDTNGPSWTRRTGWLVTNEPCMWEGIVCRDSKIYRIELSYNELSGNIPSELSNLNELGVLELEYNQLSGSIPPELGNLGNLFALNLSYNQLSGTIPSSLGGLSSINYLELSINQLTGSIPPEFGNLNGLVRLALDGNQLSGSTPPELGNLNNLSYLILRHNGLSGSIPPEFGNLLNLYRLDLDYNQLSGSIPPELGNLDNLYELSLNNNQLSGSIPPELGNLDDLNEFDLSNNQLSGSLPSELLSQPRLSELDLSHNELSGTLPSELNDDLFYLDLSHNEFVGDIPSAYGSLSHLQWLYLNDNQLSGSLPPELGNLSGLGVLHLGNNPLVGGIPLTFMKLNYLDSFSFAATYLCEPSDEAFQAWLAEIFSVESTNVICGSPDTTNPTGQLTSPASGATVTGPSITVTANASDNEGGSGVNRVRFYVFHSGTWHHINDATNEPYEATWTVPAELASQQIRFGIHVEDNARNYVMDPTPPVTVNYESSLPPPKVAVLVHGWQGLNFKAPIIYDCDDWGDGPLVYPETPSEFDSVANELHSQGYRVYIAHWTTGYAGTISVEDAAYCLYRQLQQVERDSGAAEVTLIAHSMGGLVSRAYIENSALYRGDVNHLITFGTPHAGINELGGLIKLVEHLGSVSDGARLLYCDVSPGTCQLGTDHSFAFNSVYRPSGEIRYDLIGGDGCALWSCFSYRFFRFSEGPHDGIIGRRSATGYDRFGYPVVIGDAIHRWHTGGTHVPVFGHPSYFENDDPHTISCLRYFLSNGSSGSCPSFSGLMQAVEGPEPNAASYTPTISGTLSNGVTRTFPIRLDGTESQLLLSWNRGDFDFVLQTPDGAIITPSNVTQLPGGRYQEQTDSEWLPIATYGMEPPTVGEWQAIITATNVTTTTDFVLFGALVSAITLEVEKPSSVAGGEQFTLTAQVADDGTPLSGSTVQATLIGPIGDSNVILNETAPGVYTAEMTAPEEEGQYQLIVRASGEADILFERQRDLLLYVRPNDVQLTEAASEQGVDTDGNGRYNTLRLTVPITVNRAASYVANATLRAADGTEITQARVEAEWGTGPQTLTVEFDGAAIGAAGLNGPYTVELQVVSMDTIDLTVDEKPLLQTRDYEATQFEGGGFLKLYLPLVRR